eukprot:4496974-Prymnesium_polylepis.1
MAVIVGSLHARSEGNGFPLPSFAFGTLTKSDSYPHHPLPLLPRCLFKPVEVSANRHRRRQASSSPQLAAPTQPHEPMYYAPYVPEAPPEDPGPLMSDILSWGGRTATAEWETEHRTSFTYVAPPPQYAWPAPAFAPQMPPLAPAEEPAPEPAPAAAVAAAQAEETAPVVEEAAAHEAPPPPRQLLATTERPVFHAYGRGNVKPAVRARP